MKITFISTMEGLPWGGSEYLWFNIALEALKKGCSVQVCVKEWPEEPNEINILRKKGAEIVKRQYPTASLASRAYFKLIRTVSTSGFLKKIKRFDPDKIFVSQGGTFDMFFDPELSNFIKQIDKPFFLVSQFNYENGGVLPPGVKDRVVSLMNKWKKFYFVSSRNLNVAERQSACRFKNTKVIDNPINIQKPGNTPWPSGPLKLACVARFQCSFKAQDILVETLADPQFKQYKFHLNFFGKGPDKGHVQELINMYALNANVRIQDHVSDVDKIWEEHHILILPSIAEGTPLVMQESMLKGRPVLVTDVGDSSKFVVENETGFICDVASVKCLKEKLVHVMETPMEKLKAMGTKAYHTASAQINLTTPQEILREILS